MSDSAEWLRNLARNYADGVAGMTPQDHRAWDIAEEIERLKAAIEWMKMGIAERDAANERLRAALKEALVSWEENRAFPEDQIRAALEGK